MAENRPKTHLGISAKIHKNQPITDGEWREMTLLGNSQEERSEFIWIFLGFE